MKSNLFATKTAVILGTVAALGFSTVTVAWACSIGVDQEPMVFLDEEPVEPVDLPPAVSLGLEHVKRSNTPQRQGCSQVSSSCDDIASLTLSVEGYDPEAGGLRFAIAGDYPDSLTVHNHPLVLNGEEAEVVFVWSDLDTMYEAIDAEITATWVDAWGREGETSAPLQVRNQGAEGGGCSVGGGGLGSTAALVLAAAAGLMLASRRRRVMS